MKPAQSVSSDGQSYPVRLPTNTALADRATRIVSALSGCLAVMLAVSFVIGTTVPAKAYFQVVTAIEQPQSEPVPILEAIADPDQPPVVEIATAPSNRSSLAVYKRTSRDAATWLIWFAVGVLILFDGLLIGHFQRAYLPAGCLKRRQRRPN